MYVNPITQIPYVVVLMFSSLKYQFLVSFIIVPNISHLALNDDTDLVLFNLEIFEKYATPSKKDVNTQSVINVYFFLFSSNFLSTWYGGYATRHSSVFPMI